MLCETKTKEDYNKKTKWEKNLQIIFWIWAAECFPFALHIIRSGASNLSARFFIAFGVCDGR